MEVGVQPFYPYSPDRLSAYFDAFVHNTQANYDRSIWMSTLISLRSQHSYLEDLLSKTAITLNALRDRQTRNERALSANPTPRSKKKKIVQNRWRTDKTIKTCENEERVILDCLEVCRNNVHTLESILNPSDISSTAVDHHSSISQCLYPDTDGMDIDWNGWTDEDTISPFQKESSNPFIVDEIPPEACLDETMLSELSTTEAKRPPPLSSRSRVHPAPIPVAPPNTAETRYYHSMLSPEAAVFEPSVTHYPYEKETSQELDKLSIKGLLASKHMQLITRRRFSDAAIGHLFYCLSGHTRPALVQTRLSASWAGPDLQHPTAQGHEGVQEVLLRRTNSM